VREILVTGELLLAMAANKVLRMISLALCGDALADDGLLAGRTDQVLCLVVVRLAIGLTLVLEESPRERFVAELAHEARRMPLFAQGVGAFPLDGFGAFRALGGEHVEVIRLAIGLAVVAFYDGDVVLQEIPFAHRTGQMLLVPLHPECREKIFHNRLTACRTRPAGAGRQIDGGERIGGGGASEIESPYIELELAEQGIEVIFGHLASGRLRTPSSSSHRIETGR